MDATDSPWLKVNSREAGAYARRGGRSLRKAIKAGRLRACVVGAKREYLTRREWLDEMIAAEAVVVPSLARRRA